MTQVELVRRHLCAGKSITPASAIAVYGIFRLASCIEDLRNAGTERLDIDTVMKTDEMGKQYGEYRLRRPLAINGTVQVRKGYGMGLPTWVKRLRSARVIAATGDASLVRFIRGPHMADLWLNDRELVRAD